MMGYNNGEHYVRDHTLVIANTESMSAESMLSSFLDQKNLVINYITLVNFTKREPFEIIEEIPFDSLGDGSSFFKDEHFVALEISALYMGGIQLRFEIFNDGSFRIYGYSQYKEKLFELAERIVGSAEVAGEPERD